MDIKGMGKGYLDNLKDTLHKINSSQNGDNRKNDPLSFSMSKDKFNLNQKTEQKIDNIKQVKQLLEELKNSELIKNKDSLSRFDLNTGNNGANITVSVVDDSKVTDSSFDIKVLSLSKSMVITSDDILSTKNLEMEGNLEVNGTPLIIEKSDNASSINQKINLGEDLNNNKILDSGEDLNNDSKLITKDDISVTSFIKESKLYITSKEKGANASINIDSENTIAENIGIVDSEKQLKNIIQEGKNGEVIINGEALEMVNNRVTYNGINFDFSKAIENEESRIEVKNNDEKIVSMVNDFKDKYNRLIGYVNNMIKIEDNDISNIKYRLSTVEDKSKGINLKNGNFLDKLQEMKGGVGSFLSSNLKSNGLIPNENGMIELNVETVKNNIGKIRDALKDKNVTDGFARIDQLIKPYFENVNVLDTKKSGIDDYKNSISKSEDKKSKLEELLKENKSSRDKLTEAVKHMKIDPKKVFKNSGHENNGHGNGKD